MGMEGLSNSSKPPAPGDTIIFDTSHSQMTTLRFMINDRREIKYPTSWFPLAKTLEKSEVESFSSDSTLYTSEVTVWPVGMGPIQIETKLEFKIDEKGNGTAIFYQSKVDNSRGRVNSITPDLTSGEIIEGLDADARPEIFTLEMNCNSMNLK